MRNGYSKMQKTKNETETAGNANAEQSKVSYKPTAANTKSSGKKQHRLTHT